MESDSNRLNFSFPNRFVRVSRERRGRGDLPASHKLRAGPAAAERGFRPGAGWLPLIRTGEALAGVTPQSGEWAAWLGGADNEISTLAQFILIPETATTLNFYIWLASYEGSGSCEKDFAFIRLGSHLLKTFPLCESTNTEEWFFEQIDISAFRGQSVNLSFQVVNDSSEWSNFFLDTVSISTE